MNQRKRFELYAEVMGWDTARAEDGYYVCAEMNNRWALWMGCVEFDPTAESA